MDERQFWIEFRRWLKARIIADEQMVRAIEQRYQLEERAKDLQRKPVA